VISNIKGRRWAECVDSGALREIFGPKMEEVRGDWRKLYNTEI
jgi:hypothetical protein